MAEDVKVPQLGESITEATIGRWFKQKGEAVKQDEPIAELETDKVAMEVNAPSAGVLTELLAGEGDTVEVGAVIARIDPSAEASAGPAKTEEKQEEKPGEKAAPAKAKEKAPAKAASSDQPLSPAVRKLITEHDLDPANISGTGKDGRITKEDVMKVVEGGAPSAAPPASIQRDTGPREERVPMSRLRKRIAERLKDAQNTAALLTTFNEADMTAVMETRSRFKEQFERKHGVKLGFMSFFTKACVHALKEIPAVNAEIDGDDIVYKNHYDIGVAVSAPSGLVVPVVRDADHLSFAELEKTIVNMGLKARDGKLTIDEMTGGTFTISNGGVFGSLMSAPILNPPQSGILGMHKIQERPVAINGEIVIRPMMYLALSYDHRIVDGREAVTFLVRVKDCIEEPERLLLDL